tara:strand:+ start:1110 stop:1316 length:207 start_codon:yes stop_codon:yes gene_type:complete
MKWYPECPMHKAENRQFRSDNMVFLDVWHEKYVASYDYCALEPSQGCAWAILLIKITTVQQHLPRSRG